MTKGINQASYERLAKVAQDYRDDADDEINYRRIEIDIQDFVDYASPYLPEKLDGVLENLNSTPAEQLTEENFIPIFQYLNDMLKRKDVSGHTELFEELGRKLFWIMGMSLHISNSKPTSDY